MPTDANDFTAFANERLSGWNAAMGITFVSVTLDEVVAELTIGESHLQPYGVVHGGVHCGIIETVCSVGAAVNALAHGMAVVGLENNTSFLRAVRSGKLRVTARPVSRGRRTHVWEAKVTDEQGRLAATGCVRLICLEEGASLAGAPVDPKPRVA